MDNQLAALLAALYTQDSKAQKDFEVAEYCLIQDFMAVQRKLLLEQNRRTHGLWSKGLPRADKATNAAVGFNWNKVANEAEVCNAPLHQR